MSDDSLTLTVDGTVYSGWKSATVTRSLESCASVFSLEVTERWAGQGKSWQIKPGQTAVIAIGGITIMTGYVERYQPSYSAGNHSVEISGRSKTCDLVDCMPDVKGGQYLGYKLDTIARSLAAPFGISVTVDQSADIGDAFPVAALEKTETAYAFLDKLCRMRGILACDGADGGLVLTTAGSGRAQSALADGQNIKEASASITADQRFSHYVVLSQTPMSYDSEAAQPSVAGTATDSGVTRFRRFAEIAEVPADEGGAAARAEWRARHNYGQSVEAQITVQGWRQTVGGPLWAPNLMVPVQSPMLMLDMALLIGSVTWRLDPRSGRTTELTLKPQAAYTSEPVKVKKKKGTADAWAGLQAVN